MKVCTLKAECLTAKLAIVAYLNARLRNDAVLLSLCVSILEIVFKVYGCNWCCVCSLVAAFTYMALWIVDVAVLIVKAGEYE